MFSYIMNFFLKYCIKIDMTVLRMMGKNRQGQSQKEKKDEKLMWKILES